MDLTPSFVMKFERRMRAIAEKEYLRRLSRMWVQQLLRTVPLDGASEVISWLLSTATIEPIGPSGVGGLAYESMYSQTAIIAPMTHGKGIIVQRDQLEDLAGTGLQQLSEWTEQVTSDAAFYPQRLGVQMILNGAATDGTANAYDGVPFFAKTNNPHPYNPYKKQLGGYVNWFTGAASGSYPGALPIHDVNVNANGVTLDVAVGNLGKALAAIANVKMPNGIDSRYLTPRFLLCPQAMAPRVRQLLDAKVIAQAAAGGGAGSANVEAVIRGFGLAEPIIAPELGAAFSYNAQIPTVNPATGDVTVTPKALTGSDTSWYLVCSEAETSQLGGLLHCLRRPFEIRYFTGMGSNAGGGGGEASAVLQAQLGRARQLEYQIDGRQSVQYGHPYTIYRFDAT